MTKQITIIFAVTCIAMLNAADHGEVTMEQYEEAENLLYARTAQQSNVANYYTFGVQKLYELYQACKENAPQDSTPCAKVTLALAKVFHEYAALTDEKNGHYELPLRKESFELFDEVTVRYPQANDPNVWAVAKFYQADNARWGCTKPQDYEQSIKSYQEVIDNPLVTDKNVVAWAKGRLGDSYREGQGVHQDHAKSVQLFQDIIDNADTISDKSIVAWAEFWVADAYEHGRGREKDLNKAAQLFDRITKIYVKTDPVAVMHARIRVNQINNREKETVSV
jgi:tetratricopeptide (TPR) repeat protein